VSRKPSLFSSLLVGLLVFAILRPASGDFGAAQGSGGASASGDIEGVTAGTGLTGGGTTGTVTVTLNPVIAATSITFTDVGFERSAAGIVKATDGSTGDGKFQGAAGSDANPTYAGTGANANTGIKIIGDTIYFIADGAPWGNISGSGFQLTNGAPVLAVGGSVGAPSMAFAPDADTGTLRLAENQYAVSAGGVARKVFGGSVTLTDSVATKVLTVALTSGQRAGGVVTYTIDATDGTDYQQISGTVTFGALDKAGTLTAGTPVEAGTMHVESAALTDMTDAWTIVDGTNLFELHLDANPGFASSSLVVRFEVSLNSGAATISIP